jgi:ribokinase
MDNNEQKRILVIGSYNVGFSCRTSRMPVWGETLLGSGFSVSDGGKGANQAVAAARLGGKVSFLGKVGDDAYGKAGVRMLQREGVCTDDVLFADAAHTGVGFIFLNEHGENCIIVDPGANHLLLPEDLRETSIEQADIVVFQLENRVETIEKGMRLGKEMGKTVILNPAPARSDLDHLLRLATIVTPNESELLILNGLDPSRSLSSEECRVLALKLLHKGPEAVIVTRGENGALLVTKDGHAAQFSAPKVDVVDTTGAGDSFTGALSVAISEGKSLEEAVQFACFVGAYCVTKKDVIPALPTRSELTLFCRNFSATV